MTESPPELLQFPYSHYNEKVRWALDWKGVPHHRRNYLPGPHALPIRRLTGRTQVPVVRFADGLVAGSARILDELERRYPQPALLPSQPALRERARAIQACFDAEVGPRVRRSLFAVLIREPGYLCSLFAGDRPAPVRALYRAGFPVARGMMRRSMGIDEAGAVVEADAGILAALDFVAKEAGPEGYLAGPGFSVADLAAAALLAPAVNPPHPDMQRKEPMPDAARAWLARWSGHPGARWVLAMYQRHRPAPAVP